MTTAGDYAEVFQGEDGQWYAHVCAANHEVIAQLEGHRNRDDVLDLLVDHWPGVTIVEVQQTGGEE